MKNLILADKLRKQGKKIALELEERSFKAQMRSANRSGAPLTVIRGESEIEKGIAVIKKMDDGSQCEISENDLFDYLLKHI
jgi:histidyl-tRNA synthetase